MHSNRLKTIPFFASKLDRLISPFLSAGILSKRRALRHFAVRNMLRTFSYTFDPFAGGPIKGNSAELAVDEIENAGLLGRAMEWLSRPQMRQFF